MKTGVLCLLLLPACSFLSHSVDPEVREYEVTWTCIPPENCERTDEVSRIDRVTVYDYFDFHFTSTQDASFSQDAHRIASDTLPVGCAWLNLPSLFGQELEWSKLCTVPGGYDIEISIPNENPATHSRWLVKARDLALQ